jgi:hypothetical protein
LTSAKTVDSALLSVPATLRFPLPLTVFFCNSKHATAPFRRFEIHSRLTDDLRSKHISGISTVNGLYFQKLRALPGFIGTEDHHHPGLLKSSEFTRYPAGPFARLNALSAGHRPTAPSHNTSSKAASTLHFCQYCIYGATRWRQYVKYNEIDNAGRGEKKDHAEIKQAASCG